jgi:hypothetical protein
LTFKNEETYHRMAGQGNADAFHSAYERAAERLLEQARTSQINYPNHIDGKPRFSDKQFKDLCPGDESLVVGLFQNGSEDDAKEAARSSREAFQHGPARIGKKE